MRVAILLLLLLAGCKEQRSIWSCAYYTDHPAKLTIVFDCHDY